MGIQYQDICFLLQARAEGVGFGRVLTVGRQTLMVEPAEVRDLLAAARCDADESLLADLGRGGPADALFRALGADVVESVDASGYEGATMVHDLNTPVPDAWRRRFDLVFDGGSLEHVFNFPVALTSCLDMVAGEGRILFSAPANQFCGHGFYQFSPELYHRTLSAQNGYDLELMLAVQSMDSHGRPYRVADAEALGRRVGIESGRPVTLLVRARRTRVGPLMQTPPQQSDYATLWMGGAQAGGPPGASHGPVGRSVRRLLDAVQRHRPALGEVRRVAREVLLSPERVREHPFRDVEAFTPFTWGFSTRRR